MSEKRNLFSAPKDLIDGRRPDIRERCEVFKMTALNEADQIFLAHLYRTIWIDGGTVTIRDSSDAKEVVYKFG